MVAFSGRLIAIAALSVICTNASPLKPKDAKNPAITLLRNELNFNVSSKTLRMAGSAQVTKLHRSLDNFELNTGHISSGAPSIAERALMKRDPSEAEELSPVRGGVCWSADIDIGSPPVRFRVDLDTGSTALGSCRRCAKIALAICRSALVINHRTDGTRLINEGSYHSMIPEDPVLQARHTTSSRLAIRTAPLFKVKWSVIRFS
jgi:hypothetical protein